MIHFFIIHIVLSFVSVLLAAKAVGDDIKQECGYPIHFIPVVNIFVIILSLDLIYAKFIWKHIEKRYEEKEEK